MRWVWYVVGTVAIVLCALLGRHFFFSPHGSDRQPAPTLTPADGGGGGGQGYDSQPLASATRPPQPTTSVSFPAQRDASLDTIQVDAAKKIGNTLPNEDSFLPFAAVDKNLVHQVFAAHYTSKAAEKLPEAARPALEDAVFHQLNWVISSDENSYRYYRDAMEIFSRGKRLPADFKVNPNAIRKPPTQPKTQRVGFADVPISVWTAKPSTLFPPDALKAIPADVRARLDQESVMVKVSTVEKLAEPMSDGVQYISVENVYALSRDEPGLPRVFSVAHTKTKRLETPALSVPEFLHSTH